MMRAGVLVIGSLTTSRRLIMLTPFLRVCKILISLLILVFLTNQTETKVWLTWLEDLDNDALIVGGVDTFVDFGVLSASDLLNDLVVVLGPAQVKYNYNLTRT